jgi:hypothetical protein
MIMILGSVLSGLVAIADRRPEHDRRAPQRFTKATTSPVVPVDWETATAEPARDSISNALAHGPSPAAFAAALIAAGLEDRAAPPAAPPSLDWNAPESDLRLRDRSV